MKYIKECLRLQENRVNCQKLSTQTSLTPSGRGYYKHTLSQITQQFHIKISFENHEFNQTFKE